MITLDEIKKDYHEVCYWCKSPDLSENPWCVFKDDGVTVAPICNKCHDEPQSCEKNTK